MFKAVSNKVDFAELEKEILAFWKEQGIFEKSVSHREGNDQYVFYDGPPFATGLPHYGHLLAGTIKDIVPRYWTMQGKQVHRRFGWDCHGLPVENEATKILKQEEGLDLSGKYEIEEYGVAKYNEKCRSIVLKYTAEWERVVTRMGRWVDFDNQYRTMDRDFMESIWWVFKQLWEKNLVYKGFRVTPFSWKLSTPLSNFEANSNYKEVQDPAVTVRFQLDEDPNKYILAWTTTPWTLPSNLGLAVGEDIEYVEVDAGEGKVYILAQARLAHYRKLLKADLPVLHAFKGSDLLGKGYAPLLPYFAHEKAKGAFRVIPSGHVTTGDGTGIVHMAPAFGEDDFWACREAEMPFVDPVDFEGRFNEMVSDFAGQNVKAADKGIIAKLKGEGSMVHHGTLQHNYPHCWRTDTPLIYKAIPAWFVKVEELKDRMVKHNAEIQWVPEFVGSKRFGNWLENARDWNISRNRYWGTPLPIWSAGEDDYIAIGSVEELESLSGQKVDDLHSHYVDEITFEKEGKTYRRVAEVFDCWFESGSMPYAQNHYPFENKDYFENNFPADFIAEGLDQTRGWFYTLTVLGTALFDKPPFKNVVVNGLILAEDGQKMSKSKKNYPDPEEVINRYGADCLRSYMINSPVVRAEPLRFQESGLGEIFRKVISPLWNAYSFFVQYANLDGYQPTAESLTDSPNELDRWIISHFQSLVADVNRHMTHNHLYAVVPELMAFTDLLTNWYIRRSRRRFWKAEAGDADKLHAYNTLYYILVEYAKVMAPFMPFLCETIYLNLTGGKDQESVHLCDYPKANDQLIDQAVEHEMDLVRSIVELGRSLRATHNLKVRQPLAVLSVVVPAADRAAVERLGDVIKEELNVKRIDLLEDETQFVQYSARPNLKVLGPRLGKAMKVLNPAIRELKHSDISQLLETGSLEVAGHELTADDLLIDRNEKEEQVVQTQGTLTIALDTHLTDALLLEGDARELVNRIQNLRKDAGFEVQDRIHLRVACEPLQACLAAHGAYIQQEVLATSLNGDAFEAELEKEQDINGKTALIGVARV